MRQIPGGVWTCYKNMLLLVSAGKEMVIIMVILLMVKVVNSNDDDDDNNGDYGSDNDNAVNHQNVLSICANNNEKI